MCFSKVLFKFDRTDKNMALVKKSWMYYHLREKSKSRKEHCVAVQRPDNSVHYKTGGTVSALSFWQTQALLLRRYINTEPLKKGL